MSNIHNPTYYAERERQCLMLADQARDPNARAAHLKLASLYARRAQAEPDPGSAIPAFR